MRFPLVSVETTVLVERHEQIVAFVALAFRMALFTCKQQLHVAKARCQVVDFGHGVSLSSACDSRRDRSRL